MSHVQHLNLNAAPRWRTKLHPARAVVALMALGSLWAEAGSWGVRAYPRVPLVPGFSLPPNLEFGFWVMLCACCFGFGVARAWKVFGLVSVGLFGLAVLADVNRLSPYWFNYLCLGGILYFQRADDPDSDGWLRPIITILGVQYLWAGINKANPMYLGGGFIWFTEPYFPPARTPVLILIGLFLSPLIEMALGIGLFFRRSIVYAACFGTIMHAGLLFVLGPLGRNWGAGVWPWNLGLLVLLAIVALKLRNSSAPWRPLKPRELIVTLVLAGVPIFNLFGNGLYFASYRMYTYNETSAMLYLEEGLNPSVDRWRQEVVLERGRRVSKVTLMFWALTSGTRNVYMEAPVYKKAFFDLCRSDSSRIARLDITHRWTWGGTEAPETIFCPGQP